MLQPSTSDKDQSSRSSNSHFFISSSILTKAFKSLKDKIAEKGHYIALPLFGRLVHSVQEAPTHQHLSTMGSTKTGSSRSSSAAYWSASSEKLLRQAVSLSPFLAQYILKGPVCRKKLQFWWFLSFWPSMFDSQRSQRNESRLWPRSQKVDRDFPPWVFVAWSCARLKLRAQHWLVPRWDSANRSQEEPGFIGWANLQTTNKQVLVWTNWTNAIPTLDFCQLMGQMSALWGTCNPCSNNKGIMPSHIDHLDWILEFVDSLFVQKCVCNRRQVPTSQCSRSGSSFLGTRSVAIATEVQMDLHVPPINCIPLSRKKSIPVHSNSAKSLGLLCFLLSYSARIVLLRNSGLGYPTRHIYPKLHVLPIETTSKPQASASCNAKAWQRQDNIQQKCR